MVTRRQALIAFALASAAPARFSLAQAPAQSVRIGFLSSGSPAGYSELVAAMKARLREAGYIEGKNLEIDIRWANERYDRLPALAAELVARKVEVIVTHGTPGTRAAQNATRTIPIVMATSGDAVASGLVASLARPGGNTTGLTALGHDMMRKHLELFKEILPNFSRVGVLQTAGNPANSVIEKAMADAAKKLNLELEMVSVKGPADFKEAFGALAKKRVTAVTTSQEGMLLGNAKKVADAALEHRIAVAGGPKFADSGALVGYGANFIEMYRHAAVFVDRLVKGAKPGELAVEQPTKFELVINLRTAKALGLRIPQSTLVRADRVIE